MNEIGGSFFEVGINSISKTNRSCVYKEFEEFFHDQFGQYFARAETRQQALRYIQSLLTNSGYKSTNNNSNSGKKLSKSAQRLFFGAQWDDEAVHQQLQEFVALQFGDEKGVCIIGVTYFPKNGPKTVGVQQQFNRKIGKEQNCQICLLLVYSSPKGCTFLDRRLYLPEEWTEDRTRRSEAKIPNDIEYRSKSDLALDMLQSVRAVGTPICWVIGEEPFCSETNLRNIIQAAGMNYILSGQNTESTFQRTNHRRQSLDSIDSGDDADSATIFQTVSKWEEKKWKRVIENAAGGDINVFDWASDRVLENSNDTNSGEVWLLARRSVSQRCETNYFISNAAQDTTLTNFTKITSDLKKLDQIVSEASSNFRMDEYGVRRWNSWHRHITLSMIAHTWWIYAGKGIVR